MSAHELLLHCKTLTLHLRSRTDPPKYVAVKVNRSNHIHAERELRMTDRAAKANAWHTGRPSVAILKDSFYLEAPDGPHTCLVFDVYGEPIRLFQLRFPDHRIPLEILKPVAKSVLSGLDYLHSKCHLIHAGNQCYRKRHGEREAKLTAAYVTSQSVLISTLSQTVAQAIDYSEQTCPCPRKILPDREIYTTHGVACRVDPDNLERAVITDFGCALRTDGLRNYRHSIQPIGYRAPEVCLGVQWGTAVDIWSFGLMVWTSI